MQISKALEPRKTPRQVRAKEKVNRILQVSRKLLIEEGVDRFNTNRLADTAGINIASIYQYFPNKQSILLEMYRQYLYDLEQLLIQMLDMDMGEDPDKTIDNFFTVIYNRGSEDSDAVVYERELIKAVKLNSELEAIDKAHHKWFGNMFADFFQRIKAKCSRETACQLGLYIYCLDLVFPEFLDAGGDYILALEWHRQSVHAILKPYWSDQ